MGNVFLSYSREDGVKAQRIAAALERLGHSVWWDRRLQGGSRFSKEIEQALKSADVVLVLWSRASVESAWVQDEAAEGRDNGRLVPVVIDDSKPPLGFRQYQSIDLSDWKGKANAPELDAVHEAIVAKAGGPKGEDPAPEVLAPARHYRHFRIAAVSVLALALAGLIYWLGSGWSQGQPEALRLQVGEFRALSEAVPQSVPDTLREEMLAALGTDAVIAVTGEDGASPGFELAGSVRRAGDMLRFTLHLVNESTGASVWSETLDRPSALMEAAPRQVAVGASQVLRCGLGGAARYGKPMRDDVLSTYMSFCEEYWADTLGKPGTATRALDLARRVVAAAPDFSRGWSGLAQVAMWATRGSRLISTDALKAEAGAAAERALKLDDQNSQAYEVLASLQPPFAFAQREKLHVQAVTVLPGDCGCEYVSYGGFLRRVGRNAEAVDALKRAHDMIPLSAGVNSGWAEALFVAGRSDEAQQVVANLLELWPDDRDLRAILVRSAFWTGRYDEALKALDDPKTPVSQPQRSALRMAIEALRSGSGASKLAAVDALTGIGNDPGGTPLMLVTALGALGADIEALSLANAMVQRDGPQVLAVLFEPPLANARRTPQFAELAQRYGLVSYWRTTKHVPDFCTEASPPALCARLGP